MGKIKWIIKCPHCNKEYDGLEYVDDSGLMDGEFEMCCEGCEKEFKVRFSTIIYFETEK
ncbi:hypothetical protein ACQPUY_17465 [Clostridium nigeriense]|uniref:hypothetical protein n=1 Tax=Clostridium nigeriense TaxID=1805470 RepID=UPI003D34EA23